MGVIYSTQNKKFTEISDFCGDAGSETLYSYLGLKNAYVFTNNSFYHIPRNISRENYCDLSYSGAPILDYTDTPYIPLLFFLLGFVALLTQNKYLQLLLLFTAVIYFLYLNRPPNAESLTVLSFPQLSQEFPLTAHNIQYNEIQQGGMKYEHMFFPSGTVLPMHTHDEDNISKALTDGLEYSFNGTDWIVWKKNTVVKISKLTPHSVRATSDARLVTGSKVSVLSRSVMI